MSLLVLAYFLIKLSDFSVIRKNEILSFTTTQMDLEAIMLHEISQTAKDKQYIFSPISGI